MWPPARSALRCLGTWLIGAVALVPGVATATAAAPPVLPDPVPIPALPVIADPDAESARLVPAPPECAVPPPELAVFVGTLVINDVNTARFEVEVIRSGSIDGFAVGGLIDVRYGDETRFLDVGTRYIVGAAIDPEFGVLASRVRESAPLFGGNEIAGVDDTDVDCPVFEDPVRTLMIDNSPVESGVLSPLDGASGKIVWAIVQPLGVAILILIGLVAVKLLLFALGRSLRDLGPSGAAVRAERAARANARRHRTYDDFDGHDDELDDGLDDDGRDDRDLQPAGRRASLLRRLEELDRG